MSEEKYSLNKLQSLLWIGTEKLWAARARNGKDYHYHADPEEAIKLAIDKQEEKK